MNLDIAQLVVDGRDAMESSGVAYAVIGGCARNKGRSERGKARLSE